MLFIVKVIFMTKALIFQEDKDEWYDNQF